MKHKLVNDEKLSPEIRKSKWLGLGAERTMKGKI